MISNISQYVVIFSLAGCDTNTQTVVFNAFFGNYPCPKTKMAMVFHHQQIHRKYCWWLKSCTTKDVWNPINNGKNYQPQLVSLPDFSHLVWRWFHWPELRSLQPPRWWVSRLFWKNFWPHKSRNPNISVVGRMRGTKKHLLEKSLCR